MQNITHKLALSFNKLHEDSEDLLEIEGEGEKKEEEGEAGLDTDDQSILECSFNN